jgi:CubicO group peptidase (beta-lactamase class C family)
LRDPSLRLAPLVLALLVALATVAARPAAARPLPPAAADAAALLDVWVEEHMAYHDWPGLALGVVHRGELVWSKGWGFADPAHTRPVTPQTRHRLGSVSKLFTSVAVLQLRDAGRLQLDDPVTRHLPDFAVAGLPPERPITLRHLLTHTSGLPREGAFPYWTTHEFPTRDELLAAVSGQELLSRPGDEYRYSNLGMSVLGAVVEAAAGMPWAQWVGERIAAPLGMEATTGAPTADELERLAVAWMRRLPGGERRAHDYYDTGGVAPAAAVVSTVEDLARFAALLLGDEAAVATGVLAAATVEEMRRPHFVHPSWNGGRGLGFGVTRVDGETVATHGGWIGGHRSHLLIDDERGVAVVALTNADDMSPWFFSRRAWQLLGPALAESGDEEGAAEGEEGTAEAAATPAADWERLTGLYSDPWDWHYRVMFLGGDLVVYEHAYPPTDDPAGALTRLTHVEATRFRMPDGDPFVFELDGEGRVVRIQRRSDHIFPVTR